MDDDPAHSAQVARLALQLFDGLADRHGLGDAARELLEAAALLSHVGLFISHSQHHKHSAYVIRSTDRLTGRSEEHTSEHQSLMRISYAVFCLKKKINKKNIKYPITRTKH